MPAPDSRTGPSARHGSAVTRPVREPGVAWRVGTSGFDVPAEHVLATPLLLAHRIAAAREIDQFTQTSVTAAP